MHFIDGKGQKSELRIGLIACVGSLNFTCSAVSVNKHNNLQYL